MDDITELERRITAAMDRIGAALEASSDGSSEAARLQAAMQGQVDAARAEVESLRQALETETTANAQLRERVASLKSRKDEQADQIAALEASARALEAARAADRAELDALIAALDPLVKEHPHA